LKKTLSRAAWILGLAPLLSAAVLAQEGKEPSGGAGEPDPLQEMPPENRMQQEMIDLIRKVERRLAVIDGRLSDAGAGALPLQEAEDSGLDDLLRQAQAKSRQNIEDIDRILEIANELGGSSSGSQRSRPSQETPSESPLDSERNRGPKERENTPSEPPPEQGEKPGGKEPKDGQEPRPAENPPGGENRKGDARPEQAGAGPSGADDANRWGELPVRYREVFRNQGGSELPVQYRDWIDAYHRRLSKRRR